MIKKTPIFVTGIERSGSSIIAKIIHMCDAFAGDVNIMHENMKIKNALRRYIQANPNNELIPVIEGLYIPFDWKEKIFELLDSEGYIQGPWMYKDSCLIQTWPIWHAAFPDAQWIIVRRKTADIVKSCTKTGFMKLFKDPVNREQIGVKTEEEGWLWWIHEYEKRIIDMISAGIQYKEVWPERMVTHDYKQMYETIGWLNLDWNDEIMNTIDPMLEKSRRI